MRPEQARAVEQTLSYFDSIWEEDPRAVPRFLWNAKMRFGKTFTTYQLAKRMGAKRVLVVTFKPAVQDAWREDLASHVDFEGWQYLSAKTLDEGSEVRFGKTFTTYQLAKRMGAKRVLVVTFKPAVQDAWREDLASHVDFEGWQYLSAKTLDEGSEVKADKPLVYFGSFQDLLGRDKKTGLIKSSKPQAAARQPGSSTSLMYRSGWTLSVASMRRHRWTSSKLVAARPSLTRMPVCFLTSSTRSGTCQTSLPARPWRTCSLPGTRPSGISTG